MLRIYELENNIDVLASPRVTLAKGRFQTSDPHVQKVLKYYPGVKLISEGPDEPKIGIGTSFAHVESVVVTNSVGLQMKEKRPPTSARVTGE